MRVLIACEVSGRVRDAFRARGHDAWSCDVLPGSHDNDHHFLCDIRRIVSNPVDRWDLMIAFPPCTHLAVSGARYFAGKQKEQVEALKFVGMLMEAPFPRIAVENPIGVISSRIRKPDQIIQPWMFGEPESKATCLWLKGLPKLEPTNVLQKPDCGYWNNQTPSGQNKLSPSPGRAAARAVTYRGIAEAMAEQWGRVERRGTWRR